LPTQSVSGHGFRDRLQLVRSDALEFAPGLPFPPMPTNF
jgi:hypothetical protein